MAAETVQSVDVDDRRVRTAFAVGVLIAALGCTAPIFIRDSELRQAEIAFHVLDFPAATQFAKNVLEQDPDNTQALLIAGEANARQHKSEVAAEFFSRIADDGSPASIQANSGHGERLLRLGFVRKAEAHFRQALQGNPQDLRAVKGLCFLLQVHGAHGRPFPLLSG